MYFLARGCQSAVFAGLHLSKLNSNPVLRLTPASTVDTNSKSTLKWISFPVYSTSHHITLQQFLLVNVYTRICRLSRPLINTYQCHRYLILLVISSPSCLGVIMCYSTVCLLTLIELIFQIQRILTKESSL